MRTTSPPYWTGKAWRSAPGITAPQVLMERFNVTSTSRASFALYNTRSDVDALVAGLAKAREILA